MRDVIIRQQELNDLCRRNTQQAQAELPSSGESG